MSRRGRAWLIGLAAGVVAALVLWLALTVWLPVALGLGAAIGVGVGLLTLPGAPKPIKKVTIEPTTTQQYLEASAASAHEIERQLSRLTSRSLWAQSHLDERIGEMTAGIRTLAETPSLAARERADGDVQTLYLLSTDYLPTLVNIMIENDRMHASFRGARSRDEVVRNVAALDEQSLILGEALERIESDVVQGVSRDAEQHAAFLASRFEQARTPLILDISRPRPGASGIVRGATPTNDEPAPGTPGQNGASA